MLNVLVKQLELITLLTKFDSQQIANREHANPTLPVNYGQVSSANQLHSLESLLWGFVAANHSSQITRNLTDADSMWIATRNHNSV